jgi:arylformamidase
MTDWTARRLPVDAVKGAMLISGMYDLRAVVLSSRRSYLEITPEEEALLSPMRHLHRFVCPVAVVSADQDSPEFKRQSAVFAAAIEGMGRLWGHTELYNTNHFQEMKQSRSPDSPLSQMLFSLMAL